MAYFMPNQSFFSCFSILLADHCTEVTCTKLISQLVYLYKMVADAIQPVLLYDSVQLDRAFAKSNTNNHQKCTTSVVNTLSTLMSKKLLWNISMGIYIEPSMKHLNGDPSIKERMNMGYKHTYSGPTCLTRF